MSATVAPAPGSSGTATLARVAVRGMRTHRARTALTVAAVMLGVAFVVASFALTDGIRSAFRGLVGEINAGVDVMVRARTDLADSPSGADRPLLDAALVEQVGAVDGVDAAAGIIQAIGVIPVGPDGEPATTTGAPQLGLSWVDDERLATFTLTDGRPPTGDGEVVLDRGTATDLGVGVGDRIDVLLPAGPEPRVTVTVVGIATFGDRNSLLGARATIFDLAALQRALGLEGLVSAIVVAGEQGVDPAVLAARIAAVLPDGLEAVTGERVVDETTDQIGQIITVFGGVLLGFAVVALVVSAFYINNTFTIVVGQRTRELGLLRAVGATGRQIRTVVLTEAFVVGGVASVLGIAAGWLLASGLRALLAAAGLDFPADRLPLAPRTVVAALVVGVGATLVAALAPARRAARIPPVAALGDHPVDVGGRGRRAIAGGVAVLVGALAIAWGLWGAASTAGILTATGLGALAVFVGVSRLSTHAVTGVMAVLGAPLRRLGRVPGRLAVANATRNPQRTASASSALMIGLALVAMALVAGASVSRAVADTVDSSLRADFVVSAGFQGPVGGVNPNVTARIAAVDGVEAVTGVRIGEMRVAGGVKDVTAVDPSAIGALVDIGVRAGDLAALAEIDTLALHVDPARDLGVGVGDTVAVETPVGGPGTFRVVAIYSDATLVGNHLIGTATYERHFPRSVDFLVLVRAAADADPVEVRRRLEATLEPFPQLELDDRREFRDRAASQVDQLLVVITALLGLAVLIAMLGIANTLALSVFERTRELGLLRAVGMLPRQLRRMVRWEAALIAVFGALVGAVVGIVFGAVAVAAIPPEVADSVVIPWASVVQMVVVAGLAGLVAAVLPAWRAGRLRILDAIAYE